MDQRRHGASPIGECRDGNSMIERCSGPAAISLFSPQAFFNFGQSRYYSVAD